MIEKLEQYESELDSMPCGDERAERVVMIDKARKEIMTLEAHKEQGKPTHKIEDRVNNIFNQLNR